MGYYARAYHLIAVVVAVIGVSLTPFLDYFIKEIPSELEHLQVIYLLYLFDAVASYCLVYKQSIIKADQKTYICTFYSNIFSVIRYLVLIMVLALFSKVLNKRYYYSVYSNTLYNCDEWISLGKGIQIVYIYQRRRLRKATR